MEFENTPLTWQNAGTEPSADLKTGGFEPGMKPTASVFNYFWHNASAVETELQSKLSAEATARTSGDSDLQSKINAEATVRTSGDSDLQSKINAEAASRASGDSDLLSKINAEATARASGDSSLDSKYDALTLVTNTLQTNIANEITAREQADATLQEGIADLEAELKKFVLDITFSASMKGMAFTVTGSGMTTYNGTVPDSLAATVVVPNANTTYTVKCAGKSKNITTGSYYGIYYGYVDTISTTLSENTWAQIAAVSAAGTAENYWKIGDEIDIVVNGETLTLQIFGFSHDDLTGGGKAGITFGMKNLMTETRQMNSTSTNAGSFTGSAMYDWLQNTLFPALPEDIRGLIKAVDKKTNVGQQSTAVRTDSMKLFLFSQVEVGGTPGAGGNAGEGETYPIFTDDASRKKMLTNGTGAVKSWWTRSPGATSSATFCHVLTSGHVATGGTYSAGFIASAAQGVCFGFCV